MIIARRRRTGWLNSTRALVALMVFVTVAPMATAAATSLALTTASAVLATASAQVPQPGADTVLDARVRAIASRLRCPVCQGESIQDSPSELSAQMKTLVREQLASGKSEKDVMDYFVQKYGQWILLEPKAEGINLLVYWLPVLFLAGGAIFIWFAVKRWTRPDSDTMANNSIGSPARSAGEARNTNDT